MSKAKCDTSSEHGRTTSGEQTCLERSRKSRTIRIGTSGWHYDHWAGPFYPADLSKDKWLEYYAQHFDTVELNNTFYHLPKEKSLKRWHKLAPKNFVYAVKASRYITHIKKLKDVSEELSRFLGLAALLGRKLGPILYQLPPSLHKDLGRLESFIEILPKNKIAVFEFRHESWYCEDTYKMMRKFNVGFCIHDLPGNESPKIITGDVIYIRLHGTTGRYSGCYSKSMLANWATWLKDHAKDVRSIYVYFNNDEAAYAIRNAKELKKLLRGL
jgi:uncharacterized protein YecE (DUF72 family)